VRKQRGNPLLRHAKRIIVAVVGATVLLVGTAMIFLPGPAVVVIPLGLAILATEFVWARRLLKKVRRAVENAALGRQEPNANCRNSKRE
jgi:uncharacterized protein (TIGR02611 family)